MKYKETPLNKQLCLLESTNKKGKTFRRIVPNRGEVNRAYLLLKKKIPLPYTSPVQYPLEVDEYDDWPIKWYGIFTQHVNRKHEYTISEADQKRLEELILAVDFWKENKEIEGEVDAIFKRSHKKPAVRKEVDLEYMLEEDTDDEGRSIN